MMSLYNSKSGNIKNFVGDEAYRVIKNITVDSEALRVALITPQNARAVLADLSEHDIKSICAEISNIGTIGQVRKTTREEITETFAAVGYDTVIFDDEEAIYEARKYYRAGEQICTYNDLPNRMNEYHMIVAIRAGIDKIERSKTPSRDDEYGTSILNIQIARNGSHMSIKNRYNHTVTQPDSTLNNNLDILAPGLQSMVLGYYGFASLASKKAHYNNIANIGGVYLKYHTERDNIYYGAFVLDGTNGTRFTDPSRYFITAGSGDRYYARPLVLDFKTKTATDLTDEQNGKAILLTRAMKEGLLNSSNKENAETLTATFHDAKRELLQASKKALQYINAAYGYDFTKPFTVTGFTGRFTAKSIEKATGYTDGILLVCRCGDMKASKLQSGGTFAAKDLPRATGVGNFYSQGDFENARKSGTAAIFFVNQSKEYRGQPKPEKRNASYSYRPQREKVIDSAGNDLTQSRIDLEQRLRKYKTEKRAREAAAQDFSSDIAEIDTLFAIYKERLITLLTAASTYEDFNSIKEMTNYKVAWLVRDIETIKRTAANKSFDSTEQARRMIESAKEGIKKLITTNKEEKA